MATAPKAPAPSLPRRTEYYAGGVLVYTVDGAGAVFLLLGLERRRDKGWSYMVGKVDRGERTLAACAREMHEETAGCYSLDRAAMRQLPCMAYDQQLLFFAPAVHVDARVLEALAHRAFAEGRYAFGEMVRPFPNCCAKSVFLMLLTPSRHRPSTCGFPSRTCARSGARLKSTCAPWTASSGD